MTLMRTPHHRQVISGSGIEPLLDLLDAAGQLGAEVVPTVRGLGAVPDRQVRSERLRDSSRAQGAALATRAEDNRVPAEVAPHRIRSPIWIPSFRSGPTTSQASTRYSPGSRCRDWRMAP